LEKTNEIIINVDDQIVNGEFEVKQNNAFDYDYWEFPGEFLERIIPRLEKAGLNNPFKMNGFTKIVTNDGFIISAGQCYISIENSKKNAELESLKEIQSKINKQVELYESVGIHFKESPFEIEGCITLTDNGEVFLKPERLITPCSY
jgi:NifB/MoaA-like Fe-S oxidoreductase